MGVCFVLLAFHTAFNIAADKRGQARPPEFGSDKLVGFEKPGVTGRLVIVTPLKDGTAEGVISRDIDMSFIGKNSCLDLPVSKMGVEWEGNILVYGLECLEGVTGRSQFNMVGGCGVDEVNKEGWGKQGDAIIVSIIQGKKVGSAAKGIWSSE